MLLRLIHRLINVILSARNSRNADVLTKLMDGTFSVFYARSITKLTYWVYLLDICVDWFVI